MILTLEELALTHYLSGPMTGYENYNYAAFERACNRLRPMGLKIVSPHELQVPIDPMLPDELWEYMIAKCKKEMKKCNSIIMLQGWPESSGAWVEINIARERKFPMFFYLENP